VVAVVGVVVVCIVVVVGAVVGGVVVIGGVVVVVGVVNDGAPPQEAIIRTVIHSTAISNDENDLIICRHPFFWNYLVIP